MNALKRLRRLVAINRILLRNGLDELLLASPLMRSMRYAHWLTRWRRRHTQPPAGVRLRIALEELGPVFVKFGQMLSTRRDLLPPEIIRELSLLQDRVPAFNGIQAQQLIEHALGEPVSTIFAEFSTQPMASASIAQVHAATLHDGRQVVVKVVRPGIEKTIRHDLELMYTLAELIENYWSEGKRLRPREVVAEYEKTIIDELDLVREAANASQLRRNFENSELLYVPEIHWNLVRRNVMVMERIHGIPVNDIDELRRRGTDLRRLSRNGVEIFFKQVLRDSFFHADMHPGNIFVDASDPAAPRYIAVDFGIIGTLSPVDQHYLAENFLAFFKRDYRRVAELHIESGWVPANTRVDEFESAIRTVCEPIFDRPLKEISFGNFLLSLFQTARRFRMEVQPQLVLLQKTLLHIEGLGRQLDPELDLWQTARPTLERWMRQRLGPRALVTRLTQVLPRLVEQGPELPLQLVRLIEKAESGQLQLQHDRSYSQALQREWHMARRQHYYGLGGGSLLIAAAVLYSQSPWLALGVLWLALVLLYIGRPAPLQHRGGSFQR